MSDLQKIMSLLNDAANLKSKAMELGLKYMQKNCPYKVGDRIVISSLKSQSVTYGVIASMGFSDHSKIEGLARLGIDIYTKDFTKIQKQRNRLFFDGSEWEEWKIERHYKPPFN